MPESSVLTPGELREPASDRGDPPGLFLVLCLDPFHALDLLDGWSRVPREAALSARPLPAKEADEILDKVIYRLRANAVVARSELARLEMRLAGLESTRLIVNSLRRPPCP